MSIKTIYRCDKCGAKQFTADQFWVVGIKAYALNCLSETFVSDKMQMQVCRPCLEGFGIYVQAKPKPDAPRCPTLEELIMQIAQEAVVTVFEGDELRQAKD